MDGKAKVDSVASEVNELHPLLNQLFRAMPDFEHVYYTHGPSEMGADFVLYRRDGLLKQTYQIGVIAKMGAIRQDHTDVVRQIEECAIPRMSPDGRGEIILTETWVVSTGEITVNARDKIAERFRGKKVEFIPGQRLASLIEAYLQEDLLTIPIELQTHRAVQLELLDRMDSRAALIVGVANGYVPPDVSEYKINSRNELHKSKTYTNLDELSAQVMRSNFVLIESSMGGGKSRLLRELSKYFLILDGFGEGKVIPAYISCTDLLEKYDLNVDEFCRVEMSLPPGDLVRTSIVLLDGLDELKLPAELRAKALTDFISWAQGAENRRLVLSTRPIDAREVLGPRLQNICLLRIERLQGKKAIEFFKSICGQLEVSNRILRDISSSNILRAFEATPIAYTLLAKVMLDNEQEIPASIPELFSKYFEQVLGRWEISKGLIKQVEYQAMQACLSRIAVSLLDSGRVDMPRNEALDLVREYVNARPHKIEAEFLLEQMTGRSLVLFEDENEGVVGFRHRSFAEYFYAMRLSAEPHVQVRDDAFHPFWIGVYYFLAGVRKDCPSLIEALLSVELSSSMRLLRLLNFGNILQAAYMTPQTTVSDGIKRVFGEAADLFIDCKEGKSGPELGRFSVMQILSLIRMVISEMYGYEYFKGSIDDVICDLGTGEPNERDALVLFFSCVAHAEMGGALDFDTLVEKHGDALPLELKLAVKHEAKKFNALSRVVKRMEKNLRSNIASKIKGGSSDVIRRLYYAPVDASLTNVAQRSLTVGGKKRRKTAP